MIEALETYNWREAFLAGSENPQAVLCDAAPETGFAIEEVVRIYYMEAGENDGEHWRIAGRLRDRRHFYLEAWCDYTGWDCRSGGWSKVAVDDDLFLAGVPEVVRVRVADGMWRGGVMR